MTTFESLSLVLTGVQTLAIIFTLYALWRQLKQFNLNMQDTSYSRHLEDYSRLTQILIEKPDLNEIFYSKNSEFQKLNQTERSFYNYLALAFGFLERLWLLHQRKWTDDDTWAAWERWFKEEWFPLEIFETFWKQEGHFFISPFFEYIDQEYKQFKAKEHSVVE